MHVALPSTDAADRNKAGLLSETRRLVASGYAPCERPSRMVRRPPKRGPDGSALPQGILAEEATDRPSGADTSEAGLLLPGFSGRRLPVRRVVGSQARV